MEIIVQIRPNSADELGLHSNVYVVSGGVDIRAWRLVQKHLKKAEYTIR
jgi:NH3-dependent NAD+ synthetase